MAGSGPADAPVDAHADAPASDPMFIGVGDGPLLDEPDMKLSRAITCADFFWQTNVASAVHMHALVETGAPIIVSCSMRRIFFCRKPNEIF